MFQKNCFFLHTREFSFVILFERIKFCCKNLYALIHLLNDHHQILILIFQLWYLSVIGFRLKIWGSIFFIFSYHWSFSTYRLRRNLNLVNLCFCIFPSSQLRTFLDCIGSLRSILHVILLSAGFFTYLSHPWFPLRILSSLSFRRFWFLNILILPSNNSHIFVQSY